MKYITGRIVNPIKKGSLNEYRIILFPQANMRTILKDITFTLIIILFLGTTAQAKSITYKNWISHPKIKEIREMYKDIKKGVEEGRYIKKEVTQKKPYKPNRILSKYVVKDSNGNIRSCGWHRVWGGIKEVYFDPTGTPRFRFTSKFDTTYYPLSHREYWDENGVLIWFLEEREESRNIRLIYGSDYIKSETMIYNKTKLCNEIPFPGEK